MKLGIKARIVDIFEEIPIYSAAKVHQQLLEDGVKVSLNTVASYRQELVSISIQNSRAHTPPLIKLSLI